MSLIDGVSHIALLTADLGRFRRFYEGILGIPLGVVFKMQHPPHLRHATFHVANGPVLHVFEVPDYDPTAQGIGADMGERGRVDHFGFMVADEATLRVVADRVRAAGAGDGTIRALGPLWSLHVTDPDGLQLEVNCPNLAYLGDDPADLVEEIGLPDWLARLHTGALVGSMP
jgi:catechol 2,3-dioxygenase-like lactoylglutathione lyase family enzyme